MVEALGVAAFKATDRGRKKPNNEDWVDAYEPKDAAELELSGRLYVVADGVGGAAWGERASQYAAQKVLYEYFRSSDADPGDRLRLAIRVANADIFQHTERSESQQPMGTTFVAAAVRGRQLVVANVGDSRAYLIRGGQIAQITHDHSLLQKLLDEGELTPESARSFRRKNVILRSVGADEYLEVDIFHNEIAPGDTLVLCSDGLHKYFPDPGELARLAVNGAPEQAARRLIDEANKRGGSDNISVVIVRLFDPQSPPVWTAPVEASQRITNPNWDEMPTPQRLLRRPRPNRWERLARQPLMFMVALGVLLILGVGMALTIGRFVSRPTPSPAILASAALNGTPGPKPVDSAASSPEPSAAASKPSAKAASTPGPAGGDVLPSLQPSTTLAATLMSSGVATTTTLTAQAPDLIAEAAPTPDLQHAPLCTWKVQPWTPSGSGTVQQMCAAGGWPESVCNTGYGTQFLKLNQWRSTGLMRTPNALYEGETVTIPWSRPGDLPTAEPVQPLTPTSTPPPCPGQ